MLREFWIMNGYGDEWNARPTTQLNLDSFEWAQSEQNPETKEPFCHNLKRRKKPALLSDFHSKLNYFQLGIVFAQRSPARELVRLAFASLERVQQNSTLIITVMTEMRELI